MTTIALAVAGLAAGWFGWTLTEYVLHRWGFHPRGRATRALGSRLVTLIAWEHTRHHRLPLHTQLPLRILGHVAVAAAGAPVGIVIWFFAGPTVAISAWSGWAGGYVLYEVGHWNLHHRPPRTSGGRRRRQRHYAHHSVNAATNYGVTVGWWDRVFGTESTPVIVRVPEQHAAPWLVATHQEYDELQLAGRQPDSQQTPS